MTILNILQYPDARLSRSAHKVTAINDPRIQRIIDDMLETLKHHGKSCAALAATQLDIVEPPSITVIAKTEGLTEPLCLINPQITETEGQVKADEGCMSIYPQEISAIVTRAESIKGTALDRHGKTFAIAAHGFLARCIQHEVDHLHGIVYLDHLSSLKRAFINKKISKLKS